MFIIILIIVTVLTCNNIKFITLQKDLITLSAQVALDKKEGNSLRNYYTKLSFFSYVEITNSNNRIKIRHANSS